MKIHQAVCFAMLLGISLAAFGEEPVYGSVRNGAFGSRQLYRADQAEVQAWQKAGWKLPANLELPQHWVPNPSTPNGILDYPAGSGYVRLDGGGHISSYFGPVKLKSTYLAMIRVRGKGQVDYGAYCYAAAGFSRSVPFISRPVDSAEWREYRGLFAVDRDDLISISLYLAGQGQVDVAEVTLQPGDPAEVEITREMMALYGTGALVEDLKVEAVQMDAEFAKHLAGYDLAVVKFNENLAKLDPQLTAALTAKITALTVHLKGEGKTAVGSAHFNDMMALTRVLQRLAGLEIGTATAAGVKAAVSGAENYKPGERSPRPDTVTITDIRSNKVRYDENENAATVATLVNQTGTAVSATLVAKMILGLDEEREITRGTMTLNPGVNKWNFSYSVGPETYGRAIEVQCLNEKGDLLDRWQEYYAVAVEWFRVMQHPLPSNDKSYKDDPWAAYMTHVHNFASEPTNWGVQVKEAEKLEQYLSSGVMYNLNLPSRRARFEWLLNQGVTGTFYQGPWYDGQMGYEVIRQHPEFTLYDENGQFAVDPVYGGYPNPMEVASPIEIGPKREVKKAYLDRKLSSWAHGPPNFANLDAVQYFAERIAEYSVFLNSSGVYVDGNVGVWAGYGHDGKPVVPGGRAEDYAEINARNHTLFSQILKQKNPNFGTWYNWAMGTSEYYTTKGVMAWVGSGSVVPGDPNDKNVKAAAGWKNVMFLQENQSALMGDSRPGQFLDSLCDNRDGLVQRCGANVIIGYLGNSGISHDKPGPDRWGWATHNYFGAQLIATQYHFASWFVPSWRPTLQFTTRYSRLIWAPDVKIVPDTEQRVQVQSPEELWWKRLVYRLETDQGYDLIVHLVRQPPYEKWDLKWLDEPKPLEGVRISVKAGPGKLQSVQAMRPYYFDEPQQPVQRKVEATVNEGRVEITVPEFRYHTMVVFRFAK